MNDPVKPASEARRPKVLRSSRDDKLKALRAAIDEGETSGDAGPFDFKKFIADMKAKSR